MNTQAPVVRGVPHPVAWTVAAGAFFTLSGAHNNFPVLVSIRAPFLLLSASIIGLIATMPAWRPADAAKSRPFRYAAVIFAVGLMGIPFAIVQGLAFTEVTDSYLKVLLLMGMTWAVARTPTGRLVVLRATALGFVVACGLALQAGLGGGRLSGAFVYDANDLALVANMSLPLLVWYGLDRRNPVRWLGFAALPIPLLTILRSDSRGGMLTLLAMGLATSAFYAGSAPKPLRRAFPLVCLAGMLALPFIPENTLDRFRSIANPGADYNYTSEEGRLAVWKRGMGYAITHPIFGVGMGNFGSAEGRSDIALATANQGTGFKWGAAHSVYVQAVAEIGFIGGGALIALLLLTIRDLMRVGRLAGRSADPDGMMLGLIGMSLIAYAVGGVFLSWAFYPAPYVLYGIAYAALDQMRPVANQSRRSRRALRRQWGAERPAGVYR